MKYTRVTYEERCQIAAYLKTGISIPEIAKELKYDKSTIYREIKRNSILPFGGYKKAYNPVAANKKANDRYKRCRKKTKIVGGLEQFVQVKLEAKWSPELIAGRWNKENSTSISHESIYLYTRNNPQYRQYLKRYNKRGFGRYQQRKLEPKGGENIKFRPQIANDRRRIGDWERDTMYAKDRKTVLVCTDRKSRYTKLAILKGHRADDVMAETRRLLKEAGKRVYTITNDNGGEFRSKKKEAYKVFFCDPHTPQQRGTVENMIGVLRRFIKRDTDLQNIDIQEIEDSLNFRPRKVLGYKTPYEVFFNKRVALAS